jgi:hypothetical protein
MICNPSQYHILRCPRNRGVSLVGKLFLPLFNLHVYCIRVLNTHVLSTKTFNWKFITTLPHYGFNVQETYNNCGCQIAFLKDCISPSNLTREKPLTQFLSRSSSHHLPEEKRATVLEKRHRLPYIWHPQHTGTIYHIVLGNVTLGIGCA